jgi:putative cell wall-binding protein
MHLSPRKLGAAAVAAALGVVGFGADAFATASFDLTRVSGADRYATASAVAASAFTTATNNVVIARGDDPADALAGSYLAGVLGGPLLLTSTSSVPQSTKDRLAALQAKNVYLLGGTSAISQAVQTDLGATYTVTRIQGADRFETAANIAKQTNTGGIGTVGGKKTAIIASGTSSADALAAAPASFAAKYPIVLTTASSLPTATSSALTSLGITNALVVGGTAVINASVVTQLTQLGITSERLAGNDRYETSTKIADWELANISGWSNSTIDVANGDGFADALAGGPAAGRALRPILLVQATSLPTSVATWVQARAATLTSGRVFGGTGAVSEATVTAVETAGGGGAAPRTGQVTSADKTSDRYTFVPTGATAPMTASYKASDSFAVDGQSATFAAFETALTAADTITYTPTNGTTPPSHVLTSVNAATISSGTIGNINTGATARTFDFINSVTGDTLRSGVSYDSGTYSIGGTTGKNVTEFGNDLNEGDTVTITGSTVFALTNQTVVGAINTITKGNALTPTTFKIDNLGDDPTAGGTLVTPGNDTLFSANATGDAFTGETTAFDAFTQALNDGDRVTYSRANGIETYNLVNQAPTVYSGQAASALSGTGTGGSFTLATSTKAFTVSYQGGTNTTFVVNGQLSNEAGFEAAYTAGDLISFNGGDNATSTAERLELTDQPIAGQVFKGGINTGATPNTSGVPGDSYQVLASNGFTIMATVTYSTSTATDNVYVLNGATTDLAGFEAALTQIADGLKSGSVSVTRAGTVQTHTLTTTA